MTASPSERRRAGARAALALAGGAALLAACAHPAATPLGSPLEPLSTTGARVPDTPDVVARDVAALALADDGPAAQQAVGRLSALEAQRHAAGDPPTGLVPTAQDLVNATLDDPIAYRRATETLLERDDLPPALEKRLAEEVRDDPLRLADARIHDARMATTARVFNALVAPLARSVTAGVRGAVGLMRAIVGLVVSEHLQPALDFRERQALAHWKHFLDAHPHAPEARRIAERTQETQRDWARTRRDESLRKAREALEREAWSVALVRAQQALRYEPEDPEALAIANRAASGLEHYRAERDRPVQADPASLDADLDFPPVRDLAVALLAPGGDIVGAARRLRAADKRGTWHDEAVYAEAIALHEAGPAEEDESWERLGELADEDLDASNMARHAYALYANGDENSYRAFRVTLRRDRMARVRWIVWGPLGNGPIDRDLPRWVEWLIDLPSFFTVLPSFPNRAVAYAFMKPWPWGRAPAIHARSYLEHNPEGAHAREVASWLVDWQEDRDNWMGAWEAAEAWHTESPKDLAALREKAASQALEASKTEKRPDLRAALLRRLARDFEGTDAAREAAALARSEVEEASTQEIRVSRGFLLENPEVAGPKGLGLRPELLDDDPSNGELHPDGVILVGGRTLEFKFLAPSGDPDDPPVVRRQRVSEERLARLVALLDETALRNARLDPDDTLAPDPGRDLYFERARLGLTGTADRRPTARSQYAFLGMRERYGLVRGREPILPFDIVIQGSIPDLSLGAFPRLRTPKPTPDAFLYK